MRMTVNELSFQVIDEGAGSPVLLLHGFPDSAALWRHQIPPLVAAGHRVIAPDLRGFGASDRPDGVPAYRLELLVSDLLGMLDTLGLSTVSVVGHDWGASVAWALALSSPATVERLAVLSVGHPACYFTDQIRQREMSWYVLFFQYQDIAEEALRRDDWALMRLFLRDAVDLDRYLADLSRPGALTAGLNWYRANVSADKFGQVEPPVLPVAQCPVLGIWSEHDHYLTEAQMVASAKHVAGTWRYEKIRDAGHWIPLDAPETLTTLLLEFLGDNNCPP